MSNTSSPSRVIKPITDGQIGKAQELLGAVLRKNRQQFPSDLIQEMLEKRGMELRNALLNVFQKQVEYSGMIVRHVTVNRSRSPQEVLYATGCVQWKDDSAVATMPSGGTGVEENVPVYFFKFDGFIGNDELACQYENRGLVSDPYAQAAVNTEDPAFADEHPSSTHWQDKNGKWYFVTFSRQDGRRNVRVFRNNGDWLGPWWFSGVPRK